MVFLPFLKVLIAHSATLDWRERSFVENCFASPGFLPDISRRLLFRTPETFQGRVQGSRFGHHG